MRRALIATAGTVAGLIALLDYRSSSPSPGQKVSLGGQPAPAGTPGTGGSTTTAPAGPEPTSSPGTTQGASDTTPPTTARPAALYTGTDVEYRYGDLEVRITVTDGRITSIAFPVEDAPDGRSQSINDQAIPILTREALAAQGINIDAVSGATYTSDAFAQSLEAALRQEGS